MLKSPLVQNLAYPYEEFADHLRAMRIVQEWQYTSRFGHLGSVQSSRANGSRVVEYFADSYEDQKEALRKAELFLSITDYVARHAGFFCRKELMEAAEDGSFSADPALLRAAHYVFTVSSLPSLAGPKKVLQLARAFKAID